MSSAKNYAVAVERTLAFRDGTLAGIALEGYRRQHTHYPQTLTELVPDLLPTLPIDPVNGEPLKLIVRNGKPIVYSIGAARKDNGDMPRMIDGKAANPSENLWWAVAPARDVRGDWMIFYPQPD